MPLGFGAGRQKYIWFRHHAKHLPRDIWAEYEMTLLAPGSFVRHPDKPEWGLGQVQSVIGERITVNFENAGKLLIDGRAINLEPVADPGPPDFQPRKRK